MMAVTRVLANASAEVGNEVDVMGDRSGGTVHQDAEDLSVVGDDGARGATLRTRHEANEGDPIPNAERRTSRRPRRLQCRGRGAGDVRQGDDDGGGGAVENDINPAAICIGDGSKTPLQVRRAETMEPDADASNRSHMSDTRTRHEGSNAPTKHLKRRLKRWEVVGCAGSTNRRDTL